MTTGTGVDVDVWRDVEVHLAVEMPADVAPWALVVAVAGPAGLDTGTVDTPTRAALAAGDDTTLTVTAAGRTLTVSAARDALRLRLEVTGRDGRRVLADVVDAVAEWAELADVTWRWTADGCAGWHCGAAGCLPPPSEKAAPALPPADSVRRSAVAAVLYGLAWAANVVVLVLTAVSLLLSADPDGVVYTELAPLVTLNPWLAVGRLAASYAVLYLVRVAVVALAAFGDRWQAQLRRSAFPLVVSASLAVALLAGWSPW